MKITIAHNTLNDLNNMTSIELEHHGVPAELITQLTALNEITHLAHLRFERVGDEWIYEVDDALIIKVMHIYARAARIIVPLIKPFAFAAKTFMAGIGQLKELKAHGKEIKDMATETKLDHFQRMAEEAAKPAWAASLDAELDAMDVQLHNLRSARVDAQPESMFDPKNFRPESFI